MNTASILKKLSLGVLLLSGLSLSACGGSSTSSGTAASSAISNPFVYQAYDAASMGDPTKLSATVTFWETLGKANEDSWFKPLVDQFNKTYPNITIDYSSQGGYGDIKTKLDRAVAAGTTPTMAYCYPDHVADYIHSNFAVLPMDGFTQDPTIGFQPSDGSHASGGTAISGASDYVKSYWDEGNGYQVSGLYSLPFTKSTEVLFYNKTLFDLNGWTVPETWEEMWSLCSTIKSVYPDKTPLGYDSDSNFYITLSEQMGIPYTSATGAHFLFNNDKAKAMVTSLKGYYDKGYFKTKNSMPNKAYTSDLYTAGDLLMMISSTGGTSYAVTQNFDSEVAAVPHMASSSLKVISQGPSICFFSRASWAERYAAFLFYRFCTTSLNSAYIATMSTGYNPVRISSYETDYYTNWKTEHTSDAYGKAAAITSVMGDAYFYSPVFVGSAIARDEVGGILGNVFLNSKTVDDAFTYAYNQCVTGS